MRVERFELVLSFLRKNLVIHGFSLFCQTNTTEAVQFRFKTVKVA